MPTGGNLVQLTARSSSSGDSTRGKMMPCAPQSRARATSEYCRSPTRTMGHSPAITETRQMSCTVSRSKPPCSVSMKAHWKPAAASSLGISGDRNWPKPVPSCSFPARKFCFTRFVRIEMSGDEKLMVGALQMDVFGELPDQLRTMFGEKRNNGIEAFLQVLLRIDEVRKIAGFA